MTIVASFYEACRQIEGMGFDILHAVYNGLAFGSWSIEFKTFKLPLRRLVWDGKERWLLLQTKERTDDWQETWCDHDPQGQMLDRAFAQSRQAES